MFGIIRRKVEKFGINVAKTKIFNIRWRKVIIMFFK
jgi:hypothetical protein